VCVDVCGSFEWKNNPRYIIGSYKGGLKMSNALPIHLHEVRACVALLLLVLLLDGEYETF
jgi:hypothetical protein